MFVFDKMDQRSFRSSIANAGSENNFYTLEGAATPLNFEHVFQEVDGALASIVRKLIQTRLDQPASLTAEEREGLSIVAACQIHRTKMPRTSIVDFSRKLSAMSQKLGFEGLPEISERDSKLISIVGLEDLHATVNALHSKDLLLIYFDREAFGLPAILLSYVILSPTGKSAYLPRDLRSISRFPPLCVSLSFARVSKSCLDSP